MKQVFKDIFKQYWVQIITVSIVVIFYSISTSFKKQEPPKVQVSNPELDRKAEIFRQAIDSAWRHQQDSLTSEK